MSVVLALFAIGCVLGLLLRRWWLLWAVVALAALHALWIVAFAESSENSTAQLVAISAFVFYVPALIGAFSGIMLGLLVRDRRR